ncbi:MAG TPA: hypothetical protein VEH04_04280 [Verrucomicrobiae bacterium]|nr:hypothetical protein [Verrucomicrobiae bacterium]
MPRKRETASFGALLLVVCALSLGARTSAANPYAGIMDRNVFSLKPKVEQPLTPPEPPKPPVKLTLTGITTILGNKRALLKAQIPARAGEQAKDESYMLTEGQRADGLEIKSIDVQGGKVVVDNNGITETLDFVNNGAKLLASAAPASSTPGVIPPPAGPGAGNATGGLPNLPRPMPSRQVRTGGPSDAAIGSNNTTAGQAAASAALQFQNPVSPDEQTAMIELQRLHLQDQGKHEEAALFPMTELTPAPEGAENPAPF